MILFLFLMIEFCLEPETDDLILFDLLSNSVCDDLECNFFFLAFMMILPPEVLEPVNNPLNLLPVPEPEAPPPVPLEEVVEYLLAAFRFIILECSEGTVSPLFLKADNGTFLSRELCSSHRVLESMSSSELSSNSEMFNRSSMFIC
ncbi:hypothetical protein WICPIJ_000356 [Wickerhamomyces pijperi]|uniref:Secreted protein n=1 Tax=Wickerhamomyces pijperi TaxID=599730 RepID=A0A9P8QGM2_WICPI|nr:hypothetical protein WICPIJ_000356 [Wickerhamomyces pijperi]